ncbi:hypothetical protein, partial [Mycobacterium sp. E3247]|uniref:hypothetical protein n=1 Tax=Mycobacterium sp. E3247 TaxID=1856864 RepID=UPI001E585AEF
MQNATRGTQMLGPGHRGGDFLGSHLANADLKGVSERELRYVGSSIRSVHPVSFHPGVNGGPAVPVSRSSERLLHEPQLLQLLDEP